MNNKIGKRTYQALNYLYLNSKEMQDQAIKIGANRIPLSFAKEFCTIKICTARSSGHSHAIARFVNEHSGNWAILSYNQHSSRRILETFRFVNLELGKDVITKATESKIELKNGKGYFLTHNDYDNNLRGLELNGIIVDCASMLSQKKIQEIYEVGIASMINEKYQFFIFVE